MDLGKFMPKTVKPVKESSLYDIFTSKTYQNSPLFFQNF